MRFWHDIWQVISWWNSAGNLHTGKPAWEFNNAMRTLLVILSFADFERHKALAQWSAFDAPQAWGPETTLWQEHGKITVLVTGNKFQISSEKTLTWNCNYGTGRTPAGTAWFTPETSPVIALKDVQVFFRSPFGPCAATKGYVLGGTPKISSTIRTWPFLVQIQPPRNSAVDEGGYLTDLQEIICLCCENHCWQTSRRGLSLWHWIVVKSTGFQWNLLGGSNRCVNRVKRDTHGFFLKEGNSKSIGLSVFFPLKWQFEGITMVFWCFLYIRYILLEARIYIFGAVAVFSGDWLPCGHHHLGLCGWLCAGRDGWREGETFAVFFCVGMNGIHTFIIYM